MDPAQIVQRLQRWRPTQHRQRQFLIVASVVFVLGSWFSLRALGVGLSTIRLWPLVLVAVLGVPLTLLANTAEYGASVHILGLRVSSRSALRVTVIATAANLLPIPGAFLVRTQALRDAGGGYRRATLATGTIGLVWIGVSALLAGGAVLLSAGSTAIGAAALAGGTGLLGVAYVLLRRHASSRPEQGRLLLLVVVIEIVGVAVNAGRLVLTLVGLGVGATAWQAFVLAVSSSLASATGILPAGFGVREAIAAGLSPLVALPATAGFAATAVDRVIGLLVMAPVSLALAMGSVVKGDEGSASLEAAPGHHVDDRPE